MKKLIGILGALGVISASGSSLVSCKVLSEGIEISVGSLSGKDLDVFAIPSMTQNPVQQTVINLLNLLTFGGEKVHDKDDDALIGDASIFSIDYLINHPDDKYFTDNNDGKDLAAFKKVYTGPGDSRFLSANIEKTGDAQPLQLDQFQVAGLQVASGAVNKTKTNMKEMVDAIKDKDGDDKDLYTSFNDFNGKKMLFGDLEKSINYADPKVVDDDYKPADPVAIDLDKKEPIKLDLLLSKPDDNDNGKQVVNRIFNNNLYYNQIKTTTKFDFTFRPGHNKAGDFKIVITLPVINVIYSLGVIQNPDFKEVGGKQQDLFASLTPVGYSFSHDVNQKVNLFSDLLGSANDGAGVNINISKIETPSS